MEFGQRKDVIDMACKPISHVPCVNCDQHGGTTDHLLTRCVFTGEVWSRLLRSLGLALVGPSAEDKLGLLKRMVTVLSAERVRFCSVASYLHVWREGNR